MRNKPKPELTHKEFATLNCLQWLGQFTTIGKLKETLHRFYDIPKSSPLNFRNHIDTLRSRGMVSIVHDGDLTCIRMKPLGEKELEISEQFYGLSANQEPNITREDHVNG